MPLSADAHTVGSVQGSHGAVCAGALWKLQRAGHSEVASSESCGRSKQVPLLGFGFEHLPTYRFATFLSGLHHLIITAYFNREPTSIII